uniref:Uncharacterized protein n=1 Tax=Cacopsylla melanoneura TaxID=428564 RepID=A0A8D8U3Z6_9HEMI
MIINIILLHNNIIHVLVCARKLRLAESQPRNFASFLIQVSACYQCTSNVRPVHISCDKRKCDRTRQKIFIQKNYDRKKVWQKKLIVKSLKISLATFFFFFTLLRTTQVPP